MESLQAKPRYLPATQKAEVIHLIEKYVAVGLQGLRRSEISKYLSVAGMFYLRFWNESFQQVVADLRPD